MACYTHSERHLKFSLKKKGVQNNKPLLMYGAEPSRHRPQQNTSTQWERSSNSPSLALVLVELRWYEKNTEEQGGEKERGGGEKSWEIKQSEPRARKRSDCVAEWVILLHLLPQWGGYVCGDHLYKAMMHKRGAGSGNTQQQTYH